MRLSIGDTVTSYNDLLDNSELTCVILDEYKVIYTSEKKGVAPLLDFHSLKQDDKVKGYVLVDRVIGKGAAMLADVIGISSIYTPIISKSAIEYINTHTDIDVEYIKEVPYIINRAGDGMCPVENGLKDHNKKEGTIELVLKILKNLKK